MRGRTRLTSRLVTLLSCVGLFFASAPVVLPASAASEVPALRILNSLQVNKETRDGYSRDLFKLWSDLDGDGCDTREQVLIAEAVAGVVRGCTVVGGMWISAYDGVVTSDPSSFDIDHFVPLAEAWDSGAWNWSASRRERFANDTGYAGSLIAVTASSNRSKSDRDPADWLPARGQCTYVKTWIAVKYRWSLAIDLFEKSAVQRILAGCPPLMSLPPLASAVGIDAGGSRPDPTPVPTDAAGLDPRFRTCADANAAGFGPYVRGADQEFGWYIDRDRDGLACER